MANPTVQPHLEFFPEDANGYMSDAIHGTKWLEQMDPDLLTPMIRHNGQDYFILEPTVISDGSICMPFRWYKKSDQLYAKAWKMNAVRDNAGCGWVVLQYLVGDVAESELASSFLFLIHTSYHRNLLDPRNICSQPNDFPSTKYTYMLFRCHIQG